MVKQLRVRQVPDNQLTVENGISIAFRKVVVHQDRKTLLAQCLDHVTSDIPGAAGDKNMLQESPPGTFDVQSQINHRTHRERP
jgi:hypothetical protein